MISVDEANAIIAQYPLVLGYESIQLTDAVGRTIEEDIIADRSFPPFDRVMMDGIAVSFDQYMSKNDFEIQGVQGAGKEAMSLRDGQYALEIMTGAVLPKNSDTVIRYEDLVISGSHVRVMESAIVKKGQNIHQKGTDRSNRETLIPRGSIISAAEIGVAATVGQSKLKVRQLPKIMIISTGDELVDISTKPLPHQIRRSNSYQLQALFKSQGIPSETIHIKDDLKAIKSTLAELLVSYDVLILSGGVSMGKFDFLPQALRELEVHQHFHKITQRPGKPMWFGTSNKPSCTVFALPGNPVSTFNCCIRYVLPWVKNGLGHSDRNCSAILGNDFSFKPMLTYFLQVKTKWSEGKLIADPVGGKGSGDLANLVEVDGFLELPPNQINFKKGEAFPYYSFRH